MAIVPRPVEGRFDDVLFDFIAASEGFVPRIYCDHRGIPTLGLGYALLVNTPGWPPRDSLESDLAAIGVALTAADRQRLTAVGRALSGNDSDQAKTLVAAWLPGEDSAASNSFSFLITRAQARSLFAMVRPDYEAVIRQKLGDRLTDDLANSKEMVALFSLAYNSPALIGPGLSTALRNGEREKAWYEICFGSNRRRHHGIQNRRDHEARMFSLTNADPSPSERAAVANLLQDKRAFMERYLADAGRERSDIDVALAAISESAASTRFA
ncbi:MAG: hypothetical protein RH942_00740 [Kiloniellaceae bacterium]